MLGCSSTKSALSPARYRPVAMRLRLRSESLPFWVDVDLRDYDGRWVAMAELAGERGLGLGLTADEALLADEGVVWRVEPGENFRAEAVREARCRLPPCARARCRRVAPVVAAQAGRREPRSSSTRGAGAPPRIGCLNYRRLTGPDARDSYPQPPVRSRAGSLCGVHGIHRTARIRGLSSLICM